MLHSERDTVRMCEVKGKSSVTNSLLKGPPPPLVGLLEVPDERLADLATSVGRELLLALEVGLLHPALRLIPPARGHVGGLAKRRELVVRERVRHFAAAA